MKAKRTNRVLLDQNGHDVFFAHHEQFLAVGPGKRDDKGTQNALDVKVGDRVLFGKYAGQTVKVDGQELLVMREEDIMAVLVK